jgi:M6 family metalloprotease-like protein
LHFQYITKVGKTSMKKFILTLLSFCLLGVGINTKIVKAETELWKPTVEEVKSHLENFRYSTAPITTGEHKSLVFLISFPDYTDFSPVDRQTAQEIIFGRNNTSNASLKGVRFPYESLTDYYLRSSYGKLLITGDVYGWYNAQYPLDAYERSVLIEEILNYFDDQIDYSDYDADLDGIIDSLVISTVREPSSDPNSERSFMSSIEWTGPLFDGMSVQRYVVMKDGGILNVDISTTYLQVLIHEYGHILGAFDTYDKFSDSSWSNNGGSYSNEMMNNVEWDISSFQKLVLGWIDDINVVGPSETIRINQSSFATTSEVTIAFPYEDILIIYPNPRG